MKNKLKKLLSELKGFKFVTILVLVLKKIESDDKTKYGTFYSLSKAETIINESDFDDNVFKSINTTVISNIQKSFGKSSSWIIDSVIEHNINISKYKISKELDHSRKGFFFFLCGFSSILRTLTIHKTAREWTGYLFNSSLPLPPTSKTLRH